MVLGADIYIFFPKSKNIQIRDIRVIELKILHLYNSYDLKLNLSTSLIIIYYEIQFTILFS